MGIYTKILDSLNLNEAQRVLMHVINPKGELNENL